MVGYKSRKRHVVISLRRIEEESAQMRRAVKEARFTFGHPVYKGMLFL